MHFIITIIAFFLIGCPSSKQGEQPPPAEQAKAKKQANPEPLPEGADPTLGCTTHHDCVIVSDGCGGIETCNTNSATNVKARLDAQACQPKKRADVHLVNCIDRQCRAWPGGLEKYRDGCNSPDDCVVIDGICDSYSVVNKKMQKEAEASVAKQAEHVDCMIPDVREDPPEIRCDNGYCTEPLVLVR